MFMRKNNIFFMYPTESNSSDKWGVTDYTFDSSSWNPDQFDSNGFQNTQAAYLGLCSLGAYTNGNASSMCNVGTTTDSGESLIPGMSLSSAKEAGCVRNLSSYVDGIISRMGHGLNVMYQKYMENEGLYSNIDDYAAYLKDARRDEILSFAGSMGGNIDTSFGEDLTAGSSGLQVDWEGLQRDNPDGLKQTAASLASEALKKDPIEWTDDDKIALQIYHEDLAKRTSDAESALNVSAGWDFLGTDSSYSDRVEYETLSRENKELEKVLKENGLMEYTSWEQGIRDIKQAGAALKSEGKEAWDAFKAGDYKTAAEEGFDFATKATATAGVIKDDIDDGIATVGEHLLDGAVQIGTALETPKLYVWDKLTGDNSRERALDAMYEFTSRDLVGEARTRARENTASGQFKDAYSTLSYDGAGSKLIKDTTTTATEYAAAGAITLATGGTGGALVAGAVGFVEGFGKEGERVYRQKNKAGEYTDRNAGGLAKAFAGGLEEGSKWYTVGSMVSGASAAIGTAKSISGKGALNVMKEEGKYIFTEAKNMSWEKVKTVGSYAGKQALTSGDFLTGAGINTANYVSTGIKTGEWGGDNLETFAKRTAADYASSFVTKAAGTVHIYDNIDNPKGTIDDTIIEANANAGYKGKGSDTFMIGSGGNQPGGYIRTAKDNGYSWFENSNAWTSSEVRTGGSKDVAFIDSGNKGCIEMAAKNKDVNFVINEFNGEIGTGVYDEVHVILDTRGENVVEIPIFGG